MHIIIIIIIINPGSPGKWPLKRRENPKRL